MNTIWSPRSDAEVENPLAQMRRCLSPAVRSPNPEACSGFLSGSWKLRLLLLELGCADQAGDRLWPSTWFQPDTGPVIAGLRLQAQRWQPQQLDSDDLDERLEEVAAVCLWLGDGAQDEAEAELVIELAQQASLRGLSVLAAGPCCGESELVDFAQVRQRYLSAAAKQPVAASAIAHEEQTSPLNQLLVDLPSDQRFQARVAVLSALAWDMQETGRSLHGLDRRGALALGESLQIALADVTTQAWSDDTVSLLIAAVRAKNTMDTRLRNMANDRLGLLILLATARLGLRCRSFTVREICRELGAVATGT